MSQVVIVNLSRKLREGYGYGKIDKNAPMDELHKQLLSLRLLLIEIRRLNAEVKNDV